MCKPSAKLEMLYMEMKPWSPTRYMGSLVLILWLVQLMQFEFLDNQQGLLTWNPHASQLWAQTQ